MTVVAMLMTANHPSADGTWRSCLKLSQPVSLKTRQRRCSNCKYLVTKLNLDNHNTVKPTYTCGHPSILGACIIIMQQMVLNVWHINIALQCVIANAGMMQSLNALTWKKWGWNWGYYWSNSRMTGVVNVYVYSCTCSLVGTNPNLPSHSDLIESFLDAMHKTG